MTGSIQEKNGKLYAVLSYKDQDGKSKRKWIGTGLPVRGNKKKAEAMLDDIIEDNLELEEIQEESLLFVEYVKTWLMRKRSKVQQSTWEGYEIYVTKHIVPYFEPMLLEIDQVTSKHIQDYYESRLTCPRNDHKTSGLKPISIKKHALVLNQVFEAAIIEDLVTRNPVKPVPLPKQEASEPVGKFLTADEANNMLQAFKGHDLQPLIYNSILWITSF